LRSGGAARPWTGTRTLPWTPAPRTCPRVPPCTGARAGVRHSAGRPHIVPMVFRELLGRTPSRCPSVRPSPAPALRGRCRPRRSLGHSERGGGPPWPRPRCAPPFGYPQREDRRDGSPVLFRSLGFPPPVRMDAKAGGPRSGRANLRRAKSSKRPRNGTGTPASPPSGLQRSRRATEGRRSPR